MKKKCALFLAIALFLTTTSPTLLAAPRGREERGPRERPDIVKIIKKLIRIATNDDLPTPPRP